MASKKQDRRNQPTENLDIDRRRQVDRRGETQRSWLEIAYEELYVSAYVNRIHPRFPTPVHAFSNLEQDISPAEWAAVELGVDDATRAFALRDIRSFAANLVGKGLIVNEAADGNTTEHCGLDQSLSKLPYSS